MKKITVLITDDHTLIRQSLKVVINSDPLFTVIALCSTGEEAVRSAAALQPDIVIMDVNLPGISGFEATASIRKVSPASKILAVTMHVNLECARRMIHAGVMGYVCKSSPSEELIKAATEIANGRKYICHEIKQLLSNEMIDKIDSTLKKTGLTKTERIIIDYIKTGLTSREIANTINRSTRTIDVHRQNILRKLKVPNAAALINHINQTTFD